MPPVQVVVASFRSVCVDVSVMDPNPKMFAMKLYVNLVRMVMGAPTASGVAGAVIVPSDAIVPRHTLMPFLSSPSVGYVFAS